MRAAVRARECVRCRMHVDWCEVATPFGPLHLAATDVGVVGVWFGRADDALAMLSRDQGDVTFVEDGPNVEPARRQVGEYLRGERNEVDLALHWRPSDCCPRCALQEPASRACCTT